MSDSLQHYGILGMKWGIRRTPEQLGHHSIPKGTKVYRVASTNKQSITGATYVTYLPPDRDLYRGSYATVLAKHQGSKKGDKMVETEYELTQDLNIPSRKELAQAYQNTMSNPKLKAEACKALAKEIVESDRIDYYLNYGKKTGEKYMRDDIKVWTQKYLDDFGSYTPEQAFALTARSLGSASPVVKRSVIDQLKAKGYNAMVDEAGVGGVGGAMREGVEPLILFDGDKQMSKTGTSELTRESMLEADKRHGKWARTANQHRNKPW